MSKITEFDDDRIAFDHPNLDHLTEEEAKVYTYASWDAEMTLMTIWEIQNDRMVDGRFPERLTRYERNSFLELVPEFVKSLTTVNTFEESGIIAKTELGLLRDDAGNSSEHEDSVPSREVGRNIKHNIEAAKKQLEQSPDFDMEDLTE